MPEGAQTITPGSRYWRKSLKNAMWIQAIFETKPQENSTLLGNMTLKNPVKNRDTIGKPTGMAYPFCMSHDNVI